LLAAILAALQGVGASPTPIERRVPPAGSVACVASIRALTRDDLPAVAALMEARFPGWTEGEAFLAETLLDHPWADPELPSYVAVDDGEELIGFIGAQARHMRLDDRRLRAVCASHLVVSDDQRAGVQGALLLRRLLSGPQDLTFTDSATDRVLQMWERFGGHQDHARCYDFMVVLRPVRWLSAITRAGARRRVVASGLAPVGALPIQAAGPRLLRLASHDLPLPDLAPDVEGQPAGAASIVEHLPAITRDMRLRVDYDREYLESLLALIERSAGPPVCRIVSRGDAPIGCYVYLPQRSGLARLLYLAAPAAEADAVLGELVAHTRGAGASVLAGRAEPHLHEPLRRRLAVFGAAGRAMIHAEDPEVSSLLATSSSLLTHLDGEWFTA
jgi:hypothetical protein